MMSRTRRGFTLTEILLVVALIGFLVAVATPTFLRSIKGQRLQQAARTVRAAGRYARTMAVAQGRPMQLLLTPGSGRVVVQEAPAVRPAAAAAIYTREQIYAAESAAESALPDLLSIEDAPPPPPPPGALARRPPLARDLEGIVVQAILFRDGLAESEDGPALLVYHPHGVCRPYTVHLRGEDERRAVITVDFLGEASIEIE